MRLTAWRALRFRNDVPKRELVAGDFNGKASIGDNVPRFPVAFGESSNRRLAKRWRLSRWTKQIRLLVSSRLHFQSSPLISEDWSNMIKPSRKTDALNVAKVWTRLLVFSCGYGLPPMALFRTKAPRDQFVERFESWQTDLNKQPMASSRFVQNFSTNTTLDDLSYCKTLEADHGRSPR
jgi:hypothetical protein